MKKLTLKQAWLFAAKKWDKPKKDNDGDCYVIVHKDAVLCMGLCATIARMKRTGMVTKKAAQSMREPIEEMQHEFGAWLWGWTRADARKRAAFCRKMARGCKRNEQSHQSGQGART